MYEHHWEHGGWEAVFDEGNYIETRDYIADECLVAVCAHHWDCDGWMAVFGERDYDKYDSGRFTDRCA